MLLRTERESGTTRDAAPVWAPTTVITDPDPIARARIRTLLARHAGVAPLAECSTGADTVEVVRRLRPALLLLELELPDAPGTEVACALAAERPTALVFVAARREHALSAFEYDAADYLLKPVSDDRFARMLGRVRERLAPRPAAPTTYLHRLLVRSVQKIEVVEVAQVDWLEADGDYVRLHTGKTSRLHRATLAELERHLDPAAFVRIHRSTMVRTSRIRELEPYFHGEYVVVLHDGTRLKLSRTYRARLEAALGQVL